ncbi:MAG TPA: PAS domain S-box protein [Verrucomicrobiae bacterium]
MTSERGPLPESLADIQAATAAHDARSRAPRFAWLPIPILLLAVGVSYFTEAATSYPFVRGWVTLNLILLTLVSLFMAHLIARGFLLRGSPALLPLGCGVVVWGASAAATAFAAKDMNALSTVQNSGAFLSAVCHLAGSLMFLRPVRPFRVPGLWLPVWYGAGLVVVAIITGAALGKFTPAFFVEGQGGTPLGQVALGTSTVMFGVSSFLLILKGRLPYSPFYYWYGLALGLMATGLLGIMMQPTADTLSDWIGRACVYLGGIYLLVAALATVRETGFNGASLEVALRESEERFKALAAATFEGIAVTEGGRFTDANEQLLEMLGYRREELLGLDVGAVLLPSDKMRILENINRGVESRTQLEMIRKDGSLIVVEAHGRTLEHQGRRLRFTAIRDITERERIEAKLRTSERLYRAIGESIDYGVWICAPDGHNVYASESFLALVGLTQQQCSDFGWGNVLHPDDADRTIAAWKECVRAGGKWDIEHRFRGVDGQWHHILARGIPVRDERGEITCLAGINLDISSLKQTQARLEEAKQTLDALMEYVPEGITIADASSGNIRMVSRYGTETLGTPYEGMSPGAVISKRTVFHVDGVTPMAEGDLPLTRAMRNGETVRDAELIQANASGERLWLTCNAAPIRNAKGDITGAIVAWRDVTARRKIEALLRHSEERYRSLFDGMTEGFAIHEILCDDKGIPCDYRFLDINAAFERLTGLKRSDVIGKTVKEVLPNNEPEWISIYGKVALTGEPVRFDKFSSALNRHYEVYAYRPAPAQFAVIFLDITSRKLAEQQLQAAQAELVAHADDLERTVARRTAKLQEAVAELEHLSYAIAHDLRAPLRAMQGFSEMLEDECADCHHRNTKEYLRRIRLAAARMDQLITDSLDYTKATRQELPLEPVDLVELLNGIVETYPNLQPARANIQIATDLPVVLGNEAALTQCFANLLDNAVKFSKPATHPQIRIWAEEIGRAGDGQAVLGKPPASRRSTRIWVEDDGIGIPRESLQRIFGIFQRAATTHQGTGIGLAIVRKVAQRMGGAVGVESEEGRGSRFWVELTKAP